MSGSSITIRMPNRCCVPGCKGNNRSEFRVSTHRFPKNLELRRKWLRAINRPNFEPTSHSRVCELHFKPSDIITTTTGWDSKTGKTISVRLLVPRLSSQAVPSCIPRVPMPENFKIVPKPRKPECPRGQGKKKMFKTKSQLVSNFKENERTSETEKSSHTIAPAILYINPRSKDKSDAVNMSIPEEHFSEKNEGLAVIPMQNQSSEMTMLYGPFATIEAAASLFQGANATVYSLECDTSQNSTLNHVVKVEPPDSSEELSENSTAFEIESMTVDNIDNHSNRVSSNSEDLNHNVPGKNSPLSNIVV